MREIKFRGRAISDSCGEPVNKMVYGDITQGWDKVTIFDWSDGDFYEVDPDSVAQFVGYDADNAEVYEGDVLTDEDGHEYIATLDSMLIWTKDPQIKYWHVPFNQADDDDLPYSSNKLLWDFYKNCCEKMMHTDFLRLKKE